MKSLHSDPQKTAILVLGMHRSGTSALAGALSLCGWDLGRNPLPAKDENQRGFFENRGVLEFNEWYLGEVQDSAWYQPSIPGTCPRNTDVEERFIELLNSEFEGRQKILIKDPRISLLLPLWRDLLQEQGWKVLVVFAQRPSLEVSRSLAKRDGISPDWGLNLNFLHLSIAERDSRQLPRAFLSYHGLLDDPVATLRKLQRTLELDTDLLKTAQDPIHEFLDPQLRHQRTEHVGEDPRDLPQKYLDEAFEAVASGMVEDDQPWREALDHNLGPKLSGMIGAARHQWNHNLNQSARLFHVDKLQQETQLLGEQVWKFHDGNGRVVFTVPQGVGNEFRFDPWEAAWGRLHIKSVRGQALNGDWLAGTIDLSRSNHILFENDVFSFDHTDPQIGLVIGSEIEKIEIAFHVNLFTWGTFVETLGRYREFRIRSHSADVKRLEHAVGSWELRYDDTVSSKDEVIGGLERSVAEWTNHYLQTVSDKDEIIRGLERSLIEWKALYASTVKDKDALIQGLERSVKEWSEEYQRTRTEKDLLISGLENSVAEWKALHLTTISEKDKVIEGFNQSVLQWKTRFDQAVDDKDRIIEGLKRSVQEWQTSYANTVTEKDKLLLGLQRSVEEWKTLYSSTVTDKDTLIEGLERSVKEWQSYNQQVIIDKDKMLEGLGRSLREWQIRVEEEQAQRLMESQNYESVIRQKAAELDLASNRIRTFSFYLGLNQMDVSIVIVNYNGLRFLGPVLDSLDRLSAGALKYEVVVVDNGSRDGSREFLRQREYSYPHQIVCSEENLGFAGGNNLGAKVSRGRYLVFLNNDTTPHPDWLNNLYLAAQQAGVGIVTSKLVFMPRFLRISVYTTDQLILSDELKINGRLTKLANKFAKNTLCHPQWWICFGNSLIYLPVDAHLGDLELEWPVQKWAGESDSLTIGDRTFTVAEHLEGTNLHFKIPRSFVEKNQMDIIQNAGSALNKDLDGYDIGFGEEDHGQYSEPAEVQSVCGAAMMMKKSLFRSLGGFDEYFFMYYEDLDLALRTRKAGYKLMYCPDALVRHVHTGTSQEWSPFFIYQVERNKLLMMLKNYRFRKFLLAFARYTIALRHLDQGRRVLRLRVIFGIVAFAPALIKRIWNKVWKAN